MKIESGRGVSQSSSTTRRAGTSAPSGFAPAAEGPEGPGRVASSGSAAAAHSIDAILALQGETLEPDRRGRQVRRGRRALDALDRLEQALLSGRAPAALRAELEGARLGGEMTGEPGLDAVLLEIDTRIAVELAKLEMNAQSG